ncbi:gas vesicle protein GvpG [Terrabacter sp. NPDC080008]|uniref:gas vesicle protein GvpG n=1 Tax=Terrabacter sp. NPDC080008 TaxID=3155176 RepID=UPI00344C2240
MGLITGLLTLPLAPLRGLTAVAQQILEQAEDIYYDPATIRRELETIDRLREEGEIDEDTATAREDELVDRLIEAQERGRRG